MNRRSIFDGRNGADELSVTLIVLGVVSYLAYPIFRTELYQWIAIALAVALIAWGVFRAFSTNMIGRRYENKAFVDFFKGTSDEEKARKKQAEAEEKARKARRKEDLKTHVYYRCPQCNQELRVPKGRGKIRIRCPKCGEQFERKT